LIGTYYLAYIAAVFIFYKVAMFMHDYLTKKSKTTAEYAKLATFYLIFFPMVAFLAKKNLESFILYNLLHVYAFCSLKNYIYLEKYLNSQIRYASYVAFLIINLPIILALLITIVMRSSRTFIIIESIGWILVSIAHIFISIKLARKIN